MTMLIAWSVGRLSFRNGDACGKAENLEKMSAEIMEESSPAREECPTFALALIGI
jgi:hypothetical protein